MVEANVVQGDFIVVFIDGQSEKFRDWILGFDSFDHEEGHMEFIVPDTA